MINASHARHRGEANILPMIPNRRPTGRVRLLAPTKRAAVIFHCALHLNLGRRTRGPIRIQTLLA